MRNIHKLIPVLFIFIGSVVFSQTNLPIQGTYKTQSGASFDRLEIKNNRVHSYKGNAIIGTFFAIENMNNLYVLEIAPTGSESINLNVQKDRKLMKVRVLTMDAQQCQVTITWPNGKKEDVTLTK